MAGVYFQASDLISNKLNLTHAALSKCEAYYPFQGKFHSQRWRSVKKILKTKNFTSVGFYDTHWWILICVIFHIIVLQLQVNKLPYIVTRYAFLKSILLLQNNACENWSDSSLCDFFVCSNGQRQVSFIFSPRPFIKKDMSVLYREKKDEGLLLW